MNKVEFSDEEVVTLLLILNRVGGDPHKSLRGYADSARLKLDEFFDYKQGYSDDMFEKTNNAIYFNDESRNKLSKVVAPLYIIVNGVKYKKVIE